MRTSTDPDPLLESFAQEFLTAADGVLVRAWVVGPGDLCPACPMRPECPDQRRCLHLAASVGTTTRLDGPFRRFPIGARRVGRVVVEGRPYIERGDLAERGLAEPAWLARHGVRSFAAVPLGGGRGVIAVFSRRFLSDSDVTLLAFAARVAATGAPAAPATGSRAPAVAGGPGAEQDRRTLAQIEREAIERALVQTGGRVSGPRGAATLLGLKPSTLASRMHKLGVRRPR